MLLVLWREGCRQYEPDSVHWGEVVYFEKSTLLPVCKLADVPETLVE